MPALSGSSPESLFLISSQAGGGAIALLGGGLVVECDLERQTPQCWHDIWLKCISDHVLKRAINLQSGLQLHF